MSIQLKDHYYFCYIAGIDPENYSLTKITIRREKIGDVFFETDDVLLSCLLPGAPEEPNFPHFWKEWERRYNLDKIAAENQEKRPKEDVKTRM